MKQKRKGIDADSKWDFENTHDEFDQGNSAWGSKKIFAFTPIFGEMRWCKFDFFGVTIVLWNKN